MRAVISGFYTRDGFYDGLVRRLPGMVRDQMQSDWVLGQDASAPTVAAAQDVIREVSALYARDYVAAWQAATSRITLTKWTSFDGLQSVLQTLIGPGQPLTRMLDAHPRQHRPAATAGGVRFNRRAAAQPRRAAGRLDRQRRTRGRHRRAGLPRSLAR